MDTLTHEPLTSSPIEVFRRRGRFDPIDDRRVRAAVAAGAWVRIIPGVYARAEAWRALRPHEQHRVRVLEVTHRLETPALVSHHAAAAAWGIDTLGRWPERVDVRVPRASGGRSTGRIRRYPLGVDDVATAPFGRHRVTTPAQTALDLARALPFVRGIAALDQAIWTERSGGALTDLAEIEELRAAQPSPRGDARASRVLAFASTGAANVRESQMRVLVVELGFGLPTVQERRVLPSGRVAFGDLYFPDADHWVEIDGRGKYLSPEYTGGLDAAQIVLDEKARENEIRRIVRGFSRLDALDAEHPRRVFDILTGDGLRSILPRP